jgi:hypothetical protein
VHPSAPADADELTTDPTTELDGQPALFRVHAYDAVDVEVAHVVTVGPAGHVRPVLVFLAFATRAGPLRY